MLFQKLGFLSLAWSASGVFARSLVFNSEVFDLGDPHAGDCCDSVQGVLLFHEPLTCSTVPMGVKPVRAVVMEV